MLLSPAEILSNQVRSVIHGAGFRFPPTISFREDSSPTQNIFYFLDLDQEFLRKMSIKLLHQVNDIIQLYDPQGFRY